MDNSKEDELCSVAIKTARDVGERQGVQEALASVKKELELKTQELASSLAMLRATLESTTDGILVTDEQGAVIDCNENYLTTWGIQHEVLAERDHRKLLQTISHQFEKPAEFLARIDQIYCCPAPESFDLLELADGRVLERACRVQLIANRNVGRVWSFRDITLRVHAERTLREETRILELLNGTATKLASTFDVPVILQTVIDAATQIVRARFGAFCYYNTENDDKPFVFYAQSGDSRQALASFTLPATALLRPILHSERIMRVDDIQNHPEYGKSGAQGTLSNDLPSHLLVRSYLAIEVMTNRGIAYGTLIFGHPEPAVFTARDESVLDGIAAQAVVAMDNARLFEANEQTRSQLQQLNTTLEQRVAERTIALRQSERQFQQLIAGIKDCAIYMLDPTGRVASWNSGVEHIKGYTADEIIGEHFSVFFTEEDAAAGVPQKMLEIAKQQGKYEAEAWRIRKDGTRFWASVLMDAIRNQDGSLVGFAKVTRDMTERRAMQEQLHQSQKMEAIGQLTGGVAHDFNNFLTVILGNLETLSQRIPQDDRMRRAVEQATSGAQRAATLTQQLLAYARRQPLAPKSINVNQLIKGMLDLINSTLSEFVSIKTVLGSELWNVEVDAHQLESALLNLTVNARDAMRKGGKFSIETANVNLDAQDANTFIETPPGQYVVIKVSDTGVGMDREVMARACEPFFTTKPLGQGTGLGLSQVYGFVKQSGGQVTLDSEIGHGTTVKIYLPRAQKEAESIEHKLHFDARERITNETILVVEDDEDVRAYSTESLTDMGFTVLEAADAPSALRQLEEHPEVQLIFTDVGLPGLNGGELVERVRERYPAIKVLFTTAYARDAIVHHGRVDHGIALITKPFTSVQLAARVRAILDQPASMPSA